MTETQPTTEQPTYGGDVSGLEKAAQEVTANRETGPAPAAEIDTGETAPAVGPGNMADRHDPVNVDDTINFRAGVASTLTMKVNGTAVTGGTLQLSTTAGTTTANDLHGLLDGTNDVFEGDKISFTSDGASTDGTVACNVQVLVRPAKR